MKITAHSGCDNTPCNSIEFVKYAIANGADAIEVDVRSVNGCLAVSHDATTRSVPLLRDIFEIIAAQDTVKVNCDMKEYGLEQRVCELAREYKLFGRVIYTGSIKPDNITKDMADTVEVHINIEEIVDDVQNKYKTIPNFDIECANIMINACREHGYTIVNAGYEMATATFCSMLMVQGFNVNCWTVDDMQYAKKLMDAGVFGITTHKLREARQQF